MIIFNYPEFWLYLAFFIVIGLIISPPIRQIIKRYSLHQKSKIQEKIEETENVYKEAQNIHKKVLKELSTPLKNEDLNFQIKAIQKEFIQKEKNKIDSKIQDFQLRQNLFILQEKKSLRTQLLDKVENKIFKSKYPSTVTNKEIDHFIETLEKNKNFLTQL